MQRDVGREILDRGDESAHRSERAVMLERDVHPRLIHPVIPEREVVPGRVLVLPHRAVHAERLEDVLCRVVLKAHSRHDPDDLPQQGEPEVAVLVLDPRYVGERDSACDELHQLIVRVGQLAVAPGVVLRKSGGVGEQVADRDLRRVRCEVGQRFHLGQVLRDGVVEAEPSFVPQLENGERGEALAHRGDAEEGLRVCRDLLIQVRESEVAGIDQFPVQHDAIDESRHVPLFRVLPEDLLDGGCGRFDLSSSVGIGECGGSLRVEW